MTKFPILKPKKLFVSALISGVLALVFLPEVHSQTKTRYYSASDFTLVGKALPTKNLYHRIDTASYPEIPAVVKRLLTNSAGLAVTFKTNSSVISAKWCTAPRKPTPNMTSIAYEGLDLYIKKNGKWVFAGVGRPSLSKDCSEDVLVSNLDDSEKECLIYFPLYDEIINPEIGIDANASITSTEEPFNKRVLIYGSSIVQGASAGRPGLAYPALLSRQTGMNFMNFGVSGSAKMEKEVADMVSSIPADAYILDCVPNSSPEQVTERTAYLVKKIRTDHPQAPIIMIQSIVRQHGFWDTKVGERVKQQNESYEVEYKKLKAAGVKHLYFIKGDRLLGSDHEATVDGTHPNDLGFYRMLEIIRPEVLKVLKKHAIVK